MLVGYARTSTGDQVYGLDSQIRRLTGEGCEKLFQEHASTRTGQPALDKALDYVREGDTLIVVKLDRLARSTEHLMAIVRRLREKGTDLRILDLGLDTGTPNGKLILTVMAGIAEFERDVMLERQREGIAEAKAAGKYKGRKPTARAKADQVLAMRGRNLGISRIARENGISRSSVYRILEDHGDPAEAAPNAAE